MTLLCLCTAAEVPVHPLFPAILPGHIAVPVAAVVDGDDDEHSDAGAVVDDDSSDDAEELQDIV